MCGSDARLNNTVTVIQSLHCRHPSGSERLHPCARDARSSRIDVPVSDARPSSNVVFYNTMVEIDGIYLQAGTRTNFVIFHSA